MAKTSKFHSNGSQSNHINSENEGFTNLNQAQNFEKRIERAACLSDRLE